MPCACSFSAVLTPTPHSRRTGSGCRNASSRSGGTSSSPSGLASWLATLARNFVRAMPTVIGKPDAVADLRPAAARRSRPGCPTPGAARTRRETPRPPTAARRPAWCRGTPRTPRRWPASTPTSAAARRARAGTTGGPGARPSRCARRRPWPHSSPRARRRRRRSPACRAARGRRAARPTRRTSRDQRAGWWRVTDTNICSHRAVTDYGAAP